MDEQRAIFNLDQAIAFNAILEFVINNQGYLFFIYAICQGITQRRSLLKLLDSPGS